MIDLATGGVYAHIQSLLGDADAERKRRRVPAITLDHLKSVIPREGKLLSRWADIRGFDKLLEPVDIRSIRKLISEVPENR